MQAQTEYQSQQKYSTIIKQIYQKDGAIGFYRGMIPPILGSIVFRSSQFAIVEAVAQISEGNKMLTSEIPYTIGLQPKVIFGGMAAGFVRSILECPFENAKIKRQTNQTWRFDGMYRGFQMTLCKNLGLITSYFIIFDSFKRNTNLMSSKIGQFIVSGTAACVSFWLIYPLDFIKSQIQSECKGLGDSPKERVKIAIQNHGNLGFYRGILAGSYCIFFRNGVAMIAMQEAQKVIQQLGLLD
eukprot:403356149